MTGAGRERYLTADEFAPLVVNAVEFNPGVSLGDLPLKLAPCDHGPCSACSAAIAEALLGLLAQGRLVLTPKSRLLFLGKESDSG